MRKFLILIILSVICNTVYALDYEFRIASHNMETGFLTVYELNYSDNVVTLDRTWGWFSSMVTDELLKEQVKSVEIGENGVVCFVNAADKIVAGVFSTPDASEGFIIFVNDEGNLMQIKPKEGGVNNDFAKTYQELKKSIPKHESKPQAKPTRSNPELLKLLEGPFGIYPPNASDAGLQEWRNALNKFSSNTTEQTTLGRNTLDFKNQPVKILNHDATCQFWINLHNFNSRYYIGVDGKSEALKLADDIVQSLKASGVTWKEDKTDNYFLRFVTGNWKDKYVKLSVTHNIRDLYSVIIESIGRRNFGIEDYEIVLSPSTSLGGSLFGIPNLSINQPIEEIEERFKLSLIPGSIGLNDEYIQTSKDEIEKTLFIPLKGAGDQWLGLQSESMKLENKDDSRISYVVFKLWPVSNSAKSDLSYKEEEQIVAKLYSELIDKLKTENLPIRKASMKELNIKNSDIDAKELWAVDYDGYTDYYVFRKHKYLKNICIISLKK